MKVSEVLECSLPRWLEKFEKVTFPSVCIPLPDEVLEYLRENGSLVLPSECNDESYDGKEEDYEDFGDVDWTDSEVSSDTTAADNHQRTFPEFSRVVSGHLSRFGGNVFIKLNWSSPKDATWMVLNRNLKCSSLSQIYLLLKSSDFIAHDLSQPFKDCDDVSPESLSEVSYSLVVRRWEDINPGTEFRCWISGGEVVCLCQRDISNFYPYMQREEESIKQDILTFYSEHIRNKFALSKFVMDVVRPRKDEVILVDFNPWGDTTDSLMFSWQELATDITHSDHSEVEFRYVKENSGVRPHPYMHYSLPRDVVDLATGEDPAKLIDFLRLKQRTENADSNSDDDSEEE